MLNNKLDVELIKTLTKSREMELDFIQNGLCNKSDDGYEYVNMKALKEFLGEEFIKATDRPQFALLGGTQSDESIYARVTKYYVMIWKKILDLEEQDTDDIFSGSVERKAFIRQNKSAKLKWLGFMYNNQMTEKEFWQNYAKNFNRSRMDLRYKLYFSQTELPKPRPFQPELSLFQSQVIYLDWITKMVREILDEDYSYNRDMSTGGF